MLRAFIFIVVAVVAAHALPLHGSQLSTLLSIPSTSPMTCEICEASLGDLVHEAVEAGWMGEAMCELFASCAFL
jgi:hypothetical protein